MKTIYLVRHGESEGNKSASQADPIQQSPETCNAFMWKLATKNTGVTEIKKHKSIGWRIVTWNDRSHFAED